MKKTFTNEEIAAFCQQIAVILKSGISSTEGITLMLEDTDTPDERVILQSILDGLNTHSSFAKALNDTGLFPKYMLSMIVIGEETGKLDDVMASLSSHYEREDEINKSIRNTITYPLIMSGMIIVVIIILLVKVMPIFNQVFLQLGTEMSGISKALMNIGTGISHYAIILILVIVAIIIATILAIKTNNGRVIAKKIGYNFKGTRQLLENMAACRFAGAMALTLSSGLHPDRSIELVDNLNDDIYFQKKIDVCKEKLRKGDTLASALRGSGIFSGVYSRMISLGHKTGSMEKAMDKIADMYQEEIDVKTNNVLSILEPTLVILLSVIVGIILLSVMFPLLGIMVSF